MTRDRPCAAFVPAAFAVGLYLSAFLAPDQALAFSRTSQTQLYDIAGSTAEELKDAMAQNGPHGYWAYTTWYVRWSASCEISVQINYTMPRWLDRDAAAPALRDAWDRMMKNLWRHERGHAEHGFKAASEIEASHCAGDPHNDHRQMGRGGQGLRRGDRPRRQAGRAPAGFGGKDLTLDRPIILPGRAALKWWRRRRSPRGSNAHGRRLPPHARGRLRPPGRCPCPCRWSPHGRRTSGPIG